MISKALKSSVLAVAVATLLAPGAQAYNMIQTLILGGVRRPIPSLSLVSFLPMSSGTMLV